MVQQNTNADASVEPTGNHLANGSKSPSSINRHAQHNDGAGDSHSQQPTADAKKKKKKRVRRTKPSSSSSLKQEQTDKSSNSQSIDSEGALHNQLIKSLNKLRIKKSKSEGQGPQRISQEKSKPQQSQQKPLEPSTPKAGPNKKERSKATRSRSKSKAVNATNSMAPVDVAGISAAASTKEIAPSAGIRGAKKERNSQVGTEKSRMKAMDVLPSDSAKSWRRSKEEDQHNVADPASEQNKVPEIHDLPSIYPRHLSKYRVGRLTELGSCIHGVLRINPKQDTDAYVKLSESPSANAVRINPCLEGYQVGDGNDIYICGCLHRNRAMSGDVVAIKIMSKSEAKRVYAKNRDAKDKYRMRERKTMEKRLRSMSGAVDEYFAKDCETNDDNYSLQDLDLVNATNVKDHGNIPEIFGSVVAIDSPNDNRKFSGKLSLHPPKAMARYSRLATALGKSVVWFQPLNPEAPSMAVYKSGIPNSSSLLASKKYVTVVMEEWTEYSPVPFARYIETIGKRDDIYVETKIILEENNISTDPFSPKVISCLPSGSWRIPSNEISKRTDLRTQCIFTIDPPTARDLDDAVSCRSLPNGNLLIGVHIADVSYFVRPNTALDEEARRRATTTYMVQEAIPMLPSRLCEELCSLNPGTDRLAFSVMWEMDPSNADVVSTWFGRTVINSACKLSYDDAQKIIDGSHLSASIKCYETVDDGCQRPASPARISEVESSIMWFYKLSKIMRKRRFDNGALSLTSVKLSFTLNEDGLPTSCEPYEIKDSNRLIEEFMLLANMSVAARIEATFPGAALLRRHSPPLQRRLDEICKQLDQMDIHIDSGSAMDIQYSLNKIRDPATRTTVESLLTGPMQRAMYFSTSSIDDRRGYRHYALNVPLYTHFTSPIRRYADVIVHRTLEASLGKFGNHITNDHPLLTKYLSPYFPKTHPSGSLTVKAKDLLHLIPTPDIISKIANHCNLRKDAAKKAQEASSELFLTYYLCRVTKETSTSGVVTTGVVTKIKQTCIVVTAPGFGTECVVYMDRLADKENQVVSMDRRNWKLTMWSVHPTSISLVWSAEPSKSTKDTASGQRASTLIIDESGNRIVSARVANSPLETVPQTIKVFDKIAVCLIPETNPASVKMKLAMPNIY